MVTLLAGDSQPSDAPMLQVMGSIGRQIGLFVERRKGEIALRESEARFRALADSAPVMIWLGEPDGHRTWFSRGWLDFTGRPMEQELGQGWIENVHPDDVDRVVEANRMAFEHRHEFQAEYRLRRRDGEYRWIMGNIPAILLMAASGRARGSSAAAST